MYVRTYVRNGKIQTPIQYYTYAFVQDSTITYVEDTINIIIIIYDFMSVPNKIFIRIISTNKYELHTYSKTNDPETKMICFYILPTYVRILFSRKFSIPEHLF